MGDVDTRSATSNNKLEKCVDLTDADPILNGFDMLAYMSHHARQSSCIFYIHFTVIIIIYWKNMYYMM